MKLEQLLQGLNERITDNNNKQITGSILNSELHNIIKFMLTIGHAFDTAEIGDALFKYDGMYIPMTPTMLADETCFSELTLDHLVGFVASTRKHQNGDGQLKVFSPTFVAPDSSVASMLSGIMYPWNCYKSNLSEVFQMHGSVTVHQPSEDMYNGRQNCNDIILECPVFEMETGTIDPNGLYNLNIGSQDIEQQENMNYCAPVIYACHYYRFNDNIARNDWYLGAVYEMIQICGEDTISYVNDVISAVNSRFGCSLLTFDMTSNSQMDNELWTSTAVGDKFAMIVNVKRDDYADNIFRYNDRKVRAIAVVK